jgi:hypothetical protein
LLPSEPPIGSPSVDDVVASMPIAKDGYPRLVRCCRTCDTSEQGGVLEEGGNGGSSFIGH